VENHSRPRGEGLDQRSDEDSTDWREGAHSEHSTRKAQVRVALTTLSSLVDSLGGSKLGEGVDCLEAISGEGRNGSVAVGQEGHSQHSRWWTIVS
jgi:hypothetical protein